MSTMVHDVSKLALPIKVDRTLNGRLFTLFYTGQTEQRKMLRFVLLLAIVARTATADSTCTAFDTITMGKYYLFNNLEGQDDGTGWQCTYSDWQSGDTIGWGTDWSWADNPSNVKSYASAVLGWHWGFQISDTGLPIQLSDGISVAADWSFTVDQTTAGTLDVSYDLWFHTIDNPTWEDEPTDELMIWLYYSGGAAPIGNTATTLTVGDSTYDLHVGTITWNVFSFVRTSTTESASFDIKDFTDALINLGYMENTKYLSSVESGTEIFIGDGSLNVDSYTITIG